MARRFCVLIVACAAIGATVAPAPDAGARTPVAARDISFPQCEGALPRLDSARFAILGANGGRAFTRNPCLTRQLRWAKRLPEPPAFYANTGNPGPYRSKSWPIGQTSPRTCAASEPNSVGCSFDYGWNAARHSYRVAVGAAQELHGVSRQNARQRVANVDWWLDVEILNSWQTLDGFPRGIAAQNDIATLGGAVNALWDLGIDRVGIYSTRYQWNLITGGPGMTRGWFSANPVWLAGYDDRADARDGCGDESFTGGPVLLTQFLGKDGFDSNVRCT
jgi:hypothetical protein